MAKNDLSSDQLQTLGFSSDEIPSKYSLEKYAIVSNQKASSSCTGHAIAGAMNIMYNQINDITRYSEQLVNKFSPYFIYCSLKDEEDLQCISGDGCDCGSYIKDGLALVMNYGNKKMGLDPYLKCGVTLNKTLLNKMSYMTRQYSIDDVLNFVEWKEENDKLYYRIDTEVMKEAISYGFPLVTGIFTPEDFGDVKLNYLPAKGPTGPHAVTIVGYDDNHNGGSFRVLNSYGTDWGDGGFFWISYEDLKSNFASEGIYLLYNEDLDYSSWKDPIRLSNFYKGELTNGNYWEGPMNDEYQCNGSGILVGDNFSALATYKDGMANGWWVYYGDKDDSFWGALKYEDGEIVDSEEWGFSSEEENLFITNNTKDVKLSTGSPDDDTIDFLESISDAKVKKSTFNFKKSNNYGK